jgi:glycosyltransferase involved in cell wall biosynthesis
MEDKLVSIAMATYNGEKFLREQLDSIYNQTYKNIEVVVCDDCSTDKTVEILEEYRQKYGLIYYINEKNLYCIKNFEKAISLCKGDFIALSDQDDVWLTEKIEILLEEIPDYSLIYSDVKYIDENGNILIESERELFKPEKKSIIRSFKNIPFSDSEYKICYTKGCTMLFKKEVVQKAIPIPAFERQHDWWINIVALRLNGIKYYSEPLILYRKHSNNLSSNPRSIFYNKYFNKIRLFLQPVYRIIKSVQRQHKLKELGLEV